MYENGNSGGWGGDWSAWIIIFLIFALGGFGFGGNGYGNRGGGGAADNYVLTSDFAQVERKLDSITNGLCDGFYTQAQLVNGVNTNILQTGFGLQRSIDGVATGAAMNTATITGAIKDCCCDTEKMFMQSRFDAQTYNCDTLRAIDKLGDRIIGYMADGKAQQLRDENQALRLAASQAAQNQYIIGALRPAPVPAYITCNPYAQTNTCGCM